MSENTEINLDTVQAGQELDKMIAEKIFGYSDIYVSDDGRLYAKEKESDDCRKSLSNGGKFSTNTSAAWEVLEQLIGPEGPGADIEIFKSRPAPGRIWVHLYNHKYSAFAETLPLAICRAALIAISVKS